MPYLYVAITLLAGVAGQLLLKKGLMIIGQVPKSFAEVLPFFDKFFSK